MLPPANPCFKAMKLCAKLTGSFPAALLLFTVFATANDDSPHATLRLDYHLALSEAEAPLTQLGEFYDSKLDELATRFQADGNLEGLIAVKAERKAFYEKPTEIADAYPELEKLQTIYLDTMGPRRAESLRSILEVTGIYQKQLSILIGELTKAGNLEGAVVVKEELRVTQERFSELEKEAELLLPAHGLRPAVDEPKWEELTRHFEADTITPAELTAGQGGGSDYRDLPATPGILIGLELQYSEFRGFDTVRGIRPLFLTASGREEGDEIRGNKKGRPRTVVAKKGYAISQLDVFGDNTAIRRAKITFARIAGTQLDLSDTYDSGWHGDYDDGSFSNCTSDGRFVVGVEGVSGLGIGTIRFLLAGE